MELKIKCCKCGALTPDKGNILKIKKLRVRTRRDLGRIIGCNFIAKCHRCNAEEIYDNKEVIAKHQKMHSLYWLVYGLFLGCLYLLGNKILIDFGIHQTRMGKVIDINESILTDAEILLIGSLMGFCVGLIFDILDTWKANKFNKS